MAEDEPLMALTADVVFPSEDDLFLGHEADFPVEGERDGDNIFTRPLKEAVQLAFLRTLGSLGLTPEEEQLVREASDNDLTGAYSGDELGNLTLKETVHTGFQNALNVLKGLKLSQESISEASQEVDRIEHELFPLQEIEKLPFGHAVALAFDHCETAANEMIEFFGQLRSTNTVSLLKVMDTLMPKQLEQGRKQCEAIKATLLAVKTVAQPIILIANEGSSCVGQNIPESSNRARNGYDSLLKILLQLLVGLTQTLRITLGLQNKYLDMIWWSNYSSQLDQHLRQLRRAYGIVYTSCKIARLINPSESLFVSGNPAELEPDETKKSINTAGMFGRHFGFHYPQEVRNILQVINIVRESSSSAVGASPGARNVAFLAYFVLYGNMVVLNELGLDIKKAASIGADEQNVQTIENARLYLNVVDEPLLVAGSNIISPDPFIDKGFLVDRDDAEQVALRLISFMDRPHHVASLMHPENWVERRVSSLLTKEAKDSIERLSEKIDVYLRPGAHTLARTLIFHLHGGGFIGQSSKSHGSYIRHWAANIQDSIIISVDYKLAPEYKYPYQLEEVFSSYEWTLENCGALGTLAEKIVFCGDSAGGNLAVALVVKCMERNVRLPDGVVLAYPALNLTMQLSASRVLAMFDPMMPYTLLKLCLSAYIPDDSDAATDHFLSPVFAPEHVLKDFPPLSIFSGAIDPLLDDSVQMIHNVTKAGRYGLSPNFVMHELKRSI